MLSLMPFFTPFLKTTYSLAEVLRDVVHISLTA
ncbi:hypothetical protein CKO_01285 [Citrobacter koseri ATCC BAA-895]|uniref:Uncharacterized protein n=1 Tax=Citrobacter koseri (strain ATCC BAA-895 / CDC 4225-83 / SGSC4696) TaxID=290338 RepID=A8AG13_CITK8|nr:hypothetical protein CKO_01285 [Citrobacter koseri ATCC BAA-895]